MTSITPDREPDPRRWRALWIICLAPVMLLLDVTVVNVALPPIQHDLGFSATSLAWVVNGYTVTDGGLLMLGGRMGDLLGRRRMFMIGLAVFALASASAGLAQTPGVLVASRFVEGAGAALITGGLLAIVVGLLEKGTHPWLSFDVLGWVLVGVGLLAGFALVETKAQQPLVPLSFLRSRNRTIANTVRVCYYVGFATLFFSLSLYLQHVLHFSALATGFGFVPFGLIILFSATVLAPRLLPRFGLRAPNGGGLALSTIGYLLLAGLHARGSYAADVRPGQLLVPLGGGLVLVGSTVAGLDGATGQDAGIATGLNNASMQIGSAIGLAALVSLGASHAAVLKHAGLDRLTAAADGYALSFAVAAGVTAFGALLGFFGITRPPAAPAPEPHASPAPEIRAGRAAGSPGARRG
ncbi:MAG TPA: MFS transporter [Trebonia sp.]|jgi:predicted MFS family arabinose efflux permease|nr:MFS transporter [Trebonia sp.]